MFWPGRIDLERLLKRHVERVEFIGGRAPLVRCLSGFGRSYPFADCDSRRPGTLGYLMERASRGSISAGLSQHFRADHPVFSCSKSEQQLNTWISFQAAEHLYPVAYRSAAR